MSEPKINIQPPILCWRSLQWHFKLRCAILYARVDKDYVEPLLVEYIWCSINFTQTRLPKHNLLL